MPVKDTKIKKIIDKSVDKLFEEIKLGKSEHLREYLKFVSNFYAYSFNNTMLIYSQMKESTHVASFKKWKSLGYKINKGSTAIKILAPQKYSYIISNGEKIFYRQMTKEQRENRREHISGISFFPVSVFDISQCENRGKPFEKFFISLGDSHKSKYLNLKKIVKESGIKITECDTGRAEGISFGGKIHIKKSNDFNNKLLTLIHEYAHEILHSGSENKALSRGFKECKAEATSYIVGQYLGIDNPFSSDYILNWGGTKEKLKENLTKVLIASEKIITTIERQKSIDKIKESLKENRQDLKYRTAEKDRGRDKKYTKKSRGMER